MHAAARRIPPMPWLRLYTVRVRVLWLRLSDAVAPAPALQQVAPAPALLRVALTIHLTASAPALLRSAGSIGSPMRVHA